LPPIDLIEPGHAAKQLYAAHAAKMNLRHQNSRHGFVVVSVELHRRHVVVNIHLLLSQEIGQRIPHRAVINDQKKTKTAVVSSVG